ncbi:hypothetical protein EJV47_27580 [Hymenobacter gummosus]|uniref:DUF4190 domain-containing protein n=1 Tax=Hymenobacter gummosus TaxID=1776032 RepID=A0A3S0K0M7_9BACT|nr:hypothetical protein [Hymenobacter gummosus]RTQ44754.1 hypothetical protein EJV47_27580 [Hymenobacter gummosus]
MFRRLLPLAALGLLLELAALPAHAESCKNCGEGIWGALFMGLFVVFGLPVAAGMVAYVFLSINDEHARLSRCVQGAALGHVLGGATLLLLKAASGTGFLVLLVLSNLFGAWYLDYSSRDDQDTPQE